MTTTNADLSRGQASLDLAARRAPIALAICGAISIWVGPSIWLHGELKETRKAVQANAVSVAVNAEAIEANANAIARVEASLGRVEANMDRLEEKLDQLIFYLIEEQQ